MSLLDRLIDEADVALRVLASSPRPARPSPGSDSTGPPAAAGTRAQRDEPAADRARAESAALMRVNHAGEISAQALYRGQASVTRDERLRAELLAAAAEEVDHLAWCADRVHQLGSHTSRLGPFWYAGSFAIGALAGLAGDRWSLGFLAETERQVTAHLDGHLQRLPADDVASRKIVRQMRIDEQAHATRAVARGARTLPRPVREAMRLASRVLTTVAYRI